MKQSLTAETLVALAQDMFIHLQRLFQEFKKRPVSNLTVKEISHQMSTLMNLLPQLMDKIALEAPDDPQEIMQIIRKKEQEITYLKRILKAIEENKDIKYIFIQENPYRDNKKEIKLDRHE